MHSMNLIESTLLTVVRYAVNGAVTQWGNQIDWQALKVLSVKQGIPILLIDGLQQYLSACPNFQPFIADSADQRMQRMQWLSTVITYERMYAQHEKVMAELAQFYATKGIRMMVLKGYGLSLDWPQTNHRAVGDLDIYLLPNSSLLQCNLPIWKKADQMVEKELGIKVDEEHEHHTLFSYKQVAVENHYDFINTKAHRDARKIEARLKQLVEKGCQAIEVQGAKIYLPSADFNVIFLLRHMGQHFAGEHLNLRQVLDWGFFMRAHHLEVDWEAAIGFLKEIGLYDFFNHINAICVDHLGFSADIFPPIIKNQGLEKRILMDILRPEFDDEKPQDGLMAVIAFKFRRWWKNRWKHRLVYADNLWVTFGTLSWSHLRRFKTISH